MLHTLSHEAVRSDLTLVVVVCMYLDHGGAIHSHENSLQHASINYPSKYGGMAVLLQNNDIITQLITPPLTIITVGIQGILTIKMLLYIHEYSQRLVVYSQLQCVVSVTSY